jgi:SynChlorMet cassette radical SAM/SPASM protein ScmF
MAEGTKSKEQSEVTLPKKSRMTTGKKAVKPSLLPPKWPLHQLYFYLTAGCNLRCRHCWLSPKYESGTATQYATLDFRLFQEIVAQGKELGLQAVKLTGGEPLLHPQIEDILDHIRERELTFVMETNGLLCTAELARKVRTLKNPFVSVSLDGADAATHEWVRGVRGSFDRAVQGIRNLVSAGLRPQIILSVMRRTRDQMEPMVRLAEQLGAGSVKFNVVMPTERGQDLHARGETLSLGELVETGAWVETKLHKQTKLRLFYHHPAAFRPLGKMFGAEGDGCGNCGIFGILGVLANGDYALCGIGESVPELVFGNARQDKLAKVWRGAKILNAIRRGLPQKLEGICGDCTMKRICLGSCIAQNFYRHRKLWAPYWYCEEAHREGLFPASRLYPSAVPATGEK